MALESWSGISCKQALASRSHNHPPPLSPRPSLYIPRGCPVSLQGTRQLLHPSISKREQGHRPRGGAGQSFPSAASEVPFSEPPRARPAVSKTKQPLPASPGTPTAGVCAGRQKEGTKVYDCISRGWNTAGDTGVHLMPPGWTGGRDPSPALVLRERNSRGCPTAESRARKHAFALQVHRAPPPRPMCREAGPRVQRQGHTPTSFSGNSVLISAAISTPAEPPPTTTTDRERRTCSGRKRNTRPQTQSAPWLGQGVGPLAPRRKQKPFRVWDSNVLPRGRPSPCVCSLYSCISPTGQVTAAQVCLSSQPGSRP